ncbi:hypothetical protein C8Q80DRAFT_35118 [Daedaleopsis nitida]|nr:hypothetical protein C8Q80DRAFT_35118 [Daedaleopsis nitida]
MHTPTAEAAAADPMASVPEITRRSLARTPWLRIATSCSQSRACGSGCGCLQRVCALRLASSFREGQPIGTPLPTTYPTEPRCSRMVAPALATPAARPSAPLRCAACIVRCGSAHPPTGLKVRGRHSSRDSTLHRSAGGPPKRQGHRRRTGRAGVVFENSSRKVTGRSHQSVGTSRTPQRARGLSTRLEAQTHTVPSA